jgi:5-methylcytosine-specific restriction enzyme subunit McrC
MPMNSIPIRNIYFLLCYAWDQLAEGEVVDVSGLDPTDLAELFAHVLIGGVRHVVRRGMEQGYEGRTADIQGVRGKVEVLQSARRLLLVHGRATCSFDELSANTAANRILKATLRRLAGVRSLNASLRHDLWALYRAMRGIDDIALSVRLFRTVQLHGNSRYYRFLLNICELVCGSWLVDEQTGDYRFRDFVRDDRKMALLFQNFVLNFLRRERPQLRPKSERIYWQATSDVDPDLQLLPTMTTDISLFMSPGKLIVDTKFYRNTLATFHDSESVHAANLYQMFAYLTNARAHDSGPLAGMLLYPTVDRDLNHRYRVHGLDIHVCTINLSQDWKLIRADLLSLVDSAASAVAFAA